ncbi:MAG: DUF3566 domain-containing protein [Actinomycetota bacterium]|nr:DUF3566 domain-containing protein [Actinomycetota bacterium]
MTDDVVGGPRKARLYVSRIDPWSIFKAAFMLALALGIVIVVAVAVLWWVLDYTGVFAAVSKSINDVVGSAAANFDLVSLLDFSRVLGVAVVVAAVEVVLISIVATLFAFMYNLSVGLTGGIEVVLTDQN